MAMLGFLDAAWSRFVTAVSVPDGPLSPLTCDHQAGGG